VSPDHCSLSVYKPEEGQKYKRSVFTKVKLLKNTSSYSGFPVINVTTTKSYWVGWRGGTTCEVLKY